MPVTALNAWSRLWVADTGASIDRESRESRARRALAAGSAGTSPGARWGSARAPWWAQAAS